MSADPPQSSVLCPVSFTRVFSLSRTFQLVSMKRAAAGVSMATDSVSMAPSGAVPAEVLAPRMGAMAVEGAGGPAPAAAKASPSKKQKGGKKKKKKDPNEPQK